MKKIISILVVVIFISFTSQAFAQKTKDDGGSNTKKESKIDPNDKKVVVDDETKKDDQKKDDQKKDDKNKNDDKQKNDPNKDGKKKNDNLNPDNENLDNDQKINKTDQNIESAKEKIKKAYDQLERQRKTSKMSEELYLKKKAEIQELEQQLNQLEEENGNIKKFKEKNKATK
jgi:hypothetical protein